MVLVNSYDQPYGEDLPLEYLSRLDASDGYIPTAEGLRLFSDGQGFYAAEKLPQWSYDIQSSFNYGYHAEADAELTSPTEPPSSIQSAASSPRASDTPPLTPQPSESTLTLSVEEARSLVERYIRSSSWFQEHAHEPLVGEDGVPGCALQLAQKGESVYRCFVVLSKPKRNRPAFKCATCEYTSDRLHRVVGHQRVKRNHKPFACGDDGCEFRGPTKESLSDHRSKRNSATWCPECREPIVIKNLNRHLHDIHGH